MDTHEKLLKRTIEIALDSVQNGGGPFGVVIVKDGEIVAEGSNRVTENHDPTAHAEIIAIRKACKELGDFQLDGCTIYSSCEPCPMCLGAIYWARPDEVYFASGRSRAAQAGFDDEFIYQQIDTEFEKRSIPFTKVEFEGVGKEFEAWEEKMDKVKY